MRKKELQVQVWRGKRAAQALKARRRPAQKSEAGAVLGAIKTASKSVAEAVIAATKMAARQPIGGLGERPTIEKAATKLRDAHRSVREAEELMRQVVYADRGRG